MDPSLWQKGKRIFFEVADLAPEEQEAQLARLADDDAGLKAFVQSLLRGDDAEFDFTQANPLQHLTEPTPTARDLIGTHIGPIRVIRAIGKGGMGEVYEGLDEKLGRPVAVKAIRGERRLDEHAKARMIREAKLLSRLEHPNICRLYDLVLDDEGDFLIMELVKGTDLSECLRQSFSYTEQLSIAKQIAEALAFAHERQIVHRDLKPENIMITPQRQVKVLDFGLARAYGDLDLEAGGETPEGSAFSGQSALLHTREGVIMGTPRYMSPEQANGERATTASDIYSLGLVLQKVFTGRDPYSADLALPELIDRARQGETAPVEGLSTDLTQLINRLKNPAPNLRPSALETVERLNWILAAPRRRMRRLALTVIFLSLALGIIFTSLGFYRAKRSEAAAHRMNLFLRDMLVEVRPEKAGIDLKVIDLLEDAESQIEASFSDHPGLRGDLHFTFSEIYTALGAYEKAQAHAQEACTIRQARLGAEHADTLAARDSLATTLWKQGLAEQAESIFRDVLAIDQRVLGDNHSQTMAALNNLALTMVDQGRNQEAEPLLRQAHQLHVATLGANHPDTLKTLNNLAIVLWELGKDEAADVFLDVYEKQKAALGEEHPDTLGSMNSLAVAYSHQGRQEEALALRQKALELRIKTLGPEHPNTLAAMDGLATSFSRTGRHEEALNLRLEVLEKVRRLRGNEHQNTLVSMNNTAFTLMNLKRLDEAERLFRETAEICHKALGPEHPQTLNALTNLAMTLLKMGRLEEAENLERETLAVSRRVLGDEHRGTIVIMKHLSDTLAAKGQTQESCRLLAELVGVFKRNKGVSDPSTQRAMAALATAYRDDGQEEAAATVEAELQAAVSKADN